jgi:hypothetical protein
MIRQDPWHGAHMHPLVWNLTTNSYSKAYVMCHVMHQQSADLIKDEARNKKMTTYQGAATGPNMSMLFLDDQWMNTLLTFGSFHHACH